MKKLILMMACSFIVIINFAKPPKTAPRDYYLIQIYHCSSDKQIENIDAYLKNTLLPFLHQNGISKVGVFAPIANDTAVDKRLFVWMPLKSINEIDELDQQIEKLDPMGEEALIHLENADSSLPYNRIEKILTHAFKNHPQYATKSNLTKTSSRVFEYRSYESPTENMHLRKVHMFNEGGEVNLFARLNFNAVFYSKVIAGSRMPNLIYMTSFNNMEDRNEHWKSFTADPFWKKLSAAKEYLKTVSKNETILMNARDYADF